ncbi:MAG TPA: DNA translocase FtsK, partial [Pseudomonadota bacterium]|nr:DNA translocase FtsK [Pseudomonadota bacterium]
AFVPPPAAARGKLAPAPHSADPRRAAARPAASPELNAPTEPAEDADTDAHSGARGLPSSPHSPFGAGPSELSAATADPSLAVPAHAGAAADRPGLPVPELLGEAIDKTISQSEDTSPIVLPPAESKSADEVAAAVAIAEHRPATPAAVSQPHYKPLSKTYEPPPLSLFDFEEQKQLEIDRKAMLDLAQRLESTLADYLVKGRVTAIHPGPVVTMYEFVPAPGTKLSKITALSSDLAMALEALRVRIVAPIPGKAAVGIEVPNRARETVFLKEVLADEVFLQAKSKLTMALGKDIAGTPVCVDLAKMPHLLVAGTTGSGKSVSVNGMVCSLLCNASPDDVKMIMIDPKMLELSIYEGIPHLLLPVVTDPKKANLALRWAVEEMERRYELISKAGVRDIGGYNKKVDKQILDIEQEQLDMFGDRDYDISDRPRKLPYIVVLIDEFADLMMVAAKEVEISVARIAQKARAAGIHLILATQRPSVDVITGLIKANFPSRIAFQVASRIDSRTILDAQGAENLLGMGDMLFTDRGQALRRIHGPLITDTEVHRVVEHLKQQGQPIYDMDILKPRLDEEEEAPEEDMHDDLYDQAVRLVAESRQASISMVQRRLRIGYNRAARMIERMEREGIVSAADGAKGREVLCQNL